MRPDGARGTSSRKTLSQNFLRAGSAVKRLVDEAQIGPDELVVEIGGGSGVLTRELAATGCRLLVVEKDPQFSAALKQRYAGDPRVTIVAGDVTALRWPREPFRVFANIPFGITTDILALLLGHAGTDLVRADLIVQLDVARKRTQPPQGNKLNLLWAPFWTMRLGRQLPASMFEPRPSVDAAMLHIARRPRPLIAGEDRQLWAGLLDTAFQHGAVPVRRALRAVLTSTQMQRLAAQHGISPTTPVGKLSLQDWLAIHQVVRTYVQPDRWPRPSARARGPSAARPRPSGRRAPRRPAR
jgi:23S rRNA (adenine-N6)-dimethyltransferase